MLRFRYAVTALACLAGAACTSKTPTEPAHNKGVIVVDPDSSRIFIGNTQQFTATATGTASAKATFTWSSGDPSVATVDATGLVTGVGKGKTAILATTNNLSPQMQGSGVIQVLDPSGGACNGVDTTSEWTGTLAVDFADTLIEGTDVTGARDKLQVDLSLTPDPTNLPGGTKLKFIGQPTGTVDINESVDTNGVTAVTNIGSGATSHLAKFTLYIDTDACTWHATYSWGGDATVTSGGHAIPYHPEGVADLYTRELPLGVWQQGLRYSAGIPAHVSPPTTTPADWYTVLTVLGLELFASDPTAARGPAQVDLEITP